ncbi:unknown protein [Seminavis robusta]|uniref:Uncharacterized protein n=1 Tax=Seminavis robusta TaxID=568900 RepID=A0A9N8EZT6_9STRA|nr:unknown protein [Seminavis robusta]|eukprot:Sro3234_g345720.1 n/a (1045) ;mRNA; r:2920-6054
MDHDDLVVKAIEVYRSIPDFGEVYLSREDCLVAVGMNEEIASTEQVKKQFDRRRNGMEQRHGRPEHTDNIEENTKRAVYLFQRLAVNPTAIGKKPTQAWTMALAGFKHEQRKAGACFMKVSRAIKSSQKRQQQQQQQRQAAQMPPVARQNQIPRPGHKKPPPNNHLPKPPAVAARPVPHVLIDDDDGSQVVLSPISAADSNPAFVGFDQEKEEFSFFNTPPNFCNTEMQVLFDSAYCGDSVSMSSGAKSNIDWKDARKPQGSIRSAISHLTTTTDTRRTSKAAQQERQSRRELDNIRKSLFKAATVIYNSVRANENTLSIFKSAEAVATTFNKLVGIDCLSGREIQTAVAKGSINESPPRLGRQGEIPIEEFKDFCSAVFTACAIEQSNCQERSNREQLKSIVGEILNDKRKSEGLPAMNDARFYRRIEEEICHLQDLTKADSRESLRVLWLTYKTQLRHYENWEKHAVDLGFARELTADERPNEDGYIVWHKKRLSHVLQFDEMNLALEGTDATIGGRESLIPSVTRAGIKDGGQAAEKNGASMTIMFGVNFAGEVLPPLFIFPTGATDKKNYKLKADFAATLPQLKATYGFNTERYHNVPFAVNPKGGMTKEMLSEFFSRCIIPLYPKSSDNVDNRVLVKIDSGPGRNNPDTLVYLRSLGFHLYPGMPNGTSTGQELDQMFGYLKKHIYENRAILWAARFRLEGASATLTMADVGSMVFGGVVTLTDGSTVELVDAFSEAMDAAHIHKAMDKCGYCPSTRVALKSSQIRHEVIESEDGGIDEDADPYGALLDELERKNRQAIEALHLNGYDLADNLRRSINRVTVNQVRGRASTITEPNSRERQEAIQKVGTSTAGGWFHVTNGGAPMTCDDALIAFARKDQEKQARELEKKKEKWESFQEVTAAAQQVLQQKKDSKAWKKADLQVAIQFKQGPIPTEPHNEKVSVNKPQLLALWNAKYKDMPEPTVEEWTEEDDSMLESLYAGEIVDFDRDVGLQRCWETEEDAIALRLLSFNKQRRKNVLLHVIEELEATEWDEIEADLH